MHSSDATRRRAAASANGNGIAHEVLVESGGEVTVSKPRRLATKKRGIRRNTPITCLCINVILSTAGLGLIIAGLIRRNLRRQIPNAFERKLPRINPNFQKDDTHERTPQENHYKPKLNPQDVGDKSPRFQQILREFKQLFPPDAENDRLRLEWIDSIRPHTYRPIEVSPGRAFDNELDCPDHPTGDYPRAYPTIDIINHWNPDEVSPPPDGSIYQGICVFDYNKPGHLAKAHNYREAEVPFVMRNDPMVLRSVQRWNHPAYLKRVLEGEEHRAEFSHDNHFMYWQHPRNKQMQRMAKQAGWKPPTDMQTMTYQLWLDHANATNVEHLPNESDHWYFRLIGCGGFENCDKYMSEWLFDDLDFFFPRESLYIVKPDAQKGIHCRFGMKGVIAENHFDGSRNSIVVLGGERRYILSHPKECPNLALLPKGHPSARHSAVDWSNPDLHQYPQFSQAKSNEIVLQAGDVLYLPTNWFHYIVSLGLNFQCNTRSGISSHYMQPIEECGFAM